MNGVGILIEYIENNTWARGDMKFIFEGDIEIEHEKINFISPSSYSIYYINLAQFFQKVNIPKVIS